MRQPITTGSAHAHRSRGLFLGIALIIALGLAIRILLALHFSSDAGDLQAQLDVGQRLVHAPLKAYDTPVRYLSLFHVRNYEWPYLPGYFPVLVAVRLVWHLFPDSFRIVAALPNIAADVALAGVVAWQGHHMRWTNQKVVVASILVALGPVFVIVSGAISQIDSFAIVWAVLAVVLWSREGRHRAFAAGALLGYAATVKPTPIFLLFALLPSMRNAKEGARLVGACLAVPILFSVPFLIADPVHMLRAISSNHGLPGFAGWSLAIQPGLSHDWLGGSPVFASPAIRWATQLQPIFVLLVSLAIAFLLWRFRVPTFDGAAIIMLAILFSNTNLSMNYFVWALPFVILSGWLLTALLIELVLTWPILQLWLLAPNPPLQGTYVPLQLCCLGLLGAVIVWRLSKTAKAPRATLV
jgi:hypothetical protein